MTAQHDDWRSAFADLDTSTGTGTGSPGPSLKKCRRRSAERRGLNDAVPLNALAGLRAYVHSRSTTVARSKFADEVTATAAKFYRHCRPTRDVRTATDVPWADALQPQLIEDWLAAYTECQHSAASIYNKMSYVARAGRYCRTVLGIRPAQGYTEYVTDRLVALNRQRRAEVASLKEAESDAGPTDVRDLYRRAFQDDGVHAQFTDAIARAKASTDRLSPSVFLAAMRPALAHAFVGVFARPAALYTLTLGELASPVQGDWYDDGPVVVRNATHKTSAARGALRIVLSGRSKLTVREYLHHVACRAPTEPPTITKAGRTKRLAFFGSTGAPLNASTVAKHLGRFLADAGVGDGASTSACRKAITCLARENPGVDQRGVASALAHSLPTSDRFYDTRNRDVLAVRAHEQLRALLEQDRPSPPAPAPATAAAAVEPPVRHLRVTLTRVDATTPLPPAQLSDCPAMRTRRRARVHRQ